VTAVESSSLTKYGLSTGYLYVTILADRGHCSVYPMGRVYVCVCVCVCVCDVGVLWLNA